MARAKAPEPERDMTPTVKTTVARTVAVEFPQAEGGIGATFSGRAERGGVHLRTYAPTTYSFGGSPAINIPDAAWDEFVGLLDRQRKLSKDD